MKNARLLLLVALLASASLAHAQNIVRWKTVVGVITAPNVDNPVAGSIHSGTSPWTTRGGYATVNLANGALAFNVEGLVLNGGNFTGTLPSGFPNVVGTLVCNSGSASQVILDTPQVSLSQQGDADFSGNLVGIPPAQCTNPLFLVRVPALGGKWIASGAVRTTDSQ
ncbi:MAG: hypothetical protein LAP39_28015 [Acidobacteriia bacterium]|nr:hypothetical protein [Terriglobia bacterium]